MKRAFVLIFILFCLVSCQTLTRNATKKINEELNFKAPDTISVFMKNNIEVLFNTNKKSDSIQLLSKNFRDNLKDCLLKSFAKRKIKIVNTKDKSLVTIEKITIKVYDYLSKSDIDNFKSVSVDTGIIDDFEFQITATFEELKGKKGKEIQRKFIHQTSLRHDLLTGSLLVIEEDKKKDLDNAIEFEIQQYTYKVLKALLKEKRLN